MWEAIFEGGVAVVLGTAVVGGVITVWLVRKLFFKKKVPKVYPADTVILHQIGRGPWAPSLSPFPLKLETYLRMAKIPHQVEHNFDLSSKGKTPWITYNGTQVDDSQFCIEFLNKEFGVDFNKHLSDKDKAIARAFQKMLEENSYWCFACFRWIFDEDLIFMKTTQPAAPHWILRRIAKNIKKMTYAQGMGRHTKEEVTKIITDDLKALSAFLGNKDYLMGFEPSEVDCAVFGQLAQMFFHSPDTPHEKLVKEELKNLHDYVLRMKTQYWPDWDDCITHGGIKPSGTGY